jgi:hypothetical protein
MLDSAPFVVRVRIDTQSDGSRSPVSGKFLVVVGILGHSMIFGLPKQKNAPPRQLLFHQSRTS